MVWTPDHKISWASAVVAELVQNLEILSIHHDYMRIAEVSHVKEALFWIGRECDSTSRITLTIAIDEHLRDIGAVNVEYLDALVGTIRDVH
jgi:hypothetical protein